MIYKYLDTYEQVVEIWQKIVATEKNPNTRAETAENPSANKFLYLS